MTEFPKTIDRPTGYIKFFGHYHCRIFPLMAAGYKIFPPLNGLGLYLGGEHDYKIPTGFITLMAIMAPPSPVIRS